MDYFSGFSFTSRSTPRTDGMMPANVNGNRQPVVEQAHKTHDRLFMRFERLRDSLQRMNPDPSYADEREDVLRDLAAALAERDVSSSSVSAVPVNSTSGYPGDAEASEVSRLREENQRLTAEVSRLQERSPTGAGSQDCSACRLRAVLTKRETTTRELRSAIEGVEVLVVEARRELSASQFRERRAAYESLYACMDKGDEESLEKALSVAREVELDLDDIIKAENKLLDLKMVDPEEKAKRLARQKEGKNKKEAFVLVKKDDADGIKALIDSLEEGVRWQEWRDYAGRSLWKCAHDLRAPRVQQYLAAELGMSQLELGGPRRSVHKATMIRQTSEGSSQGDGAAVPNGGERSEASSSTAVAGADNTATPARDQMRKASIMINPSVVEIPELGFRPSIASPSKDGRLSTLSDTFLHGRGSSMQSPETPTSVSRMSTLNGDDPNASLKAQALRAVAQDDTEKLIDVLQQVHSEEWVQWKNKAGKDLLTLSQERGSTLAYGILARELGMLKELHREAFEEREAVWIFEIGEVQPRRATVLEDAPEEADEILIEFWDGDEPPVRMERCLVRKMHG